MHNIVRVMALPILPTNHVGTMACRIKGRPLTGILLLDVPNDLNCWNSRTVGQIGCRSKGRNIISTKNTVGRMGFPLFRRANIPKNGKIVGYATPRTKESSK